MTSETPMAWDEVIAGAGRTASSKRTVVGDGQSVRVTLTLMDGAEARETVMVDSWDAAVAALNDAGGA